MSTSTTTDQPNVREWALRYTTDRGMYVIPVPYLSKEPVLKAWQKMRLKPEEIPDHFNGHQQNIGGLMGIAQEGCTPYMDVDLDAPEAVRLAPAFLPSTGAVFGRKSKPRSHWLYMCVQPPKTRKYQDPTDNSVLVEQRGLNSDGEVGLQTIIPPSVRGRDPKKDPPEYIPEPVQWYSYGEARIVEAEEIARCISRLSAAVLLVRQYPTVGGRQELHLALSGGLLRAGWPREDARQFMRAVADAAEDEEVEKRVACVDATADKLEADKSVTGWPTLAGMLGERVVQKVRDWLGVQSAGDASDPNSHDSSKGQSSQATRIVKLALAQKCELFHTPEGQGYIRFRLAGHVENHPLQSRTPFTLDKLEDFFRLLPTRGDSDRSWTVERADIEAKDYDLKAVNPKARAEGDTRTPEQLLDIIEAKAAEVAEALAALRALK